MKILVVKCFDGEISLMKAEDAEGNKDVGAVLDSFEFLPSDNKDGEIHNLLLAFLRNKNYDLHDGVMQLLTLSYNMGIRVGLKASNHY